MKRILGLLLSVGLVCGLMVEAAAAGKSKPEVVGKDAPDDWGQDAFPGASEVGSALGQELVEAAIGMADAKTINFVIKVESLPPWGGWPEVTRYLWDMNVDNQGVQLDGKFTNYSRGICDPTSGQCPPPRDPGTQPFFVRTDCRAEAVGIVCTEKAIVKASFDAGAGTITIPIPLKVIDAKSGSEISPANLFYGGVAAVPSAFASSTGMPLDLLMPTKNFVVP